MSDAVVSVVNTVSAVNTVLVVNTGSTGVKLALVDCTRDEAVAQSSADVDTPAKLAQVLGDFVAGLSAQPDAVGHRVVQGGTEGRPAVRLDAAEVARISSLRELAPLHQDRALAGIAAAQEFFPDLPAFACYDTAFHATLSPAAATYALPAEWRRNWSELRRYGFHGISHAYAAERAAELLHVAPTELRVVSLHLGGGSSACAVAGGRSVDTTMGFSPLEGLVMQTRSGSIDPAAVLWLQERGLEPAEIQVGLEHRSGVAGLSATSGDLREVRARADAGDENARLALDVFVQSVVRSVGAMAAAMGGVDVLVFTGGIGEHDAGVRATVVHRLGFLGFALDESPERIEALAGGSGDVVLSPDTAAAAVCLVRAREDLAIARSVAALCA